VQLKSPDSYPFGTSFQRQTGANIIPGEKITPVEIHISLHRTTFGTSFELPNN
jgi:hypothetical protein